MELVDGESLSCRLSGGAALAWREAVTMCAQVAAALATAHARGIVHRDVTPGNVMLTAAGAKVVDFGISALVGERDIGPDGTLLGTPAYLAPERLDGAPVSPATDVYAVGLLLYRSLTGRLPWHAATTTQMLRAHLHTEPEPMPAVDGLPEAVAELCRRCLAKQPADRPRTAEIAQILASAVGTPVPVSPAARVHPGGHERDPAAEGTAILPLAAAADALAPSPRRPGRARRWAIRRRAEVVVVGMGLLAVTGLIWAGTSRTPNSADRASGAPAEGLESRPTGCRVTYQATRDTGRGFTAVLTVTNTGSEATKEWQLTFDLPGDQRLSSGQYAQWRQSGHTVVALAPGGARLAPGGSVRLALAGSYAAANPFPVSFDLNGNQCDAIVQGSKGETGAGPGSSGGDGSGHRGRGEDLGHGKGRKGRGD
jgi:serine/threonine-protein kinase